jgi:DNA-binding NarL/FixJ family response regulator
MHLRIAASRPSFEALQFVPTDLGGLATVLRVAIVDDHPVARCGIASILDAVADIAVVCAVSCADELGDAEAVDVVLLDLYEMDGRLALRSIARLAAHRPVLVVSASRARADVLAAVRAGAAGYLTKQASEAAYAIAIRAAARGQFHLSAQLADIIDSAASERHPTLGPARLSPREHETLGFIAKGFTHQQTATRMGVSKATVDTYVARIRSKLQVGNKAGLALAALPYGPTRVSVSE